MQTMTPTGLDYVIEDGVLLLYYYIHYVDMMWMNGAGFIRGKPFVRIFNFVIGSFRVSTLVEQGFVVL
jgi:hypothetical protein